MLARERGEPGTRGSLVRGWTDAGQQLQIGALPPGDPGHLVSLRGEAPVGDELTLRGPREGGHMGPLHPPEDSSSCFSWAANARRAARVAPLPEQSANIRGANFLTNRVTMSTSPPVYVRTYV